MAMLTSLVGRLAADLCRAVYRRRGEPSIANRWPDAGLPHEAAGPAPAHRPRPAPDVPRVFALGDREEHYLGAADQVLERHIAHVMQEPAVDGAVSFDSRFLHD